MSVTHESRYVRKAPVCQQGATLVRSDGPGKKSLNASSRHQHDMLGQASPFAVLILTLWSPLLALGGKGGGATHFGDHSAMHAGRQYVHSDADLSSFLEMYAKRPALHHNVQNNPCGIRLNHAFALWSIVRHIQPTTLIESGVNTGLSTYVMRHAAPKARIISIDPLAEALSMGCRRQGVDLTDFKHDEKVKGFFPPGKTQPRVRTNRWIDATNNEYLVGERFVDFASVDWAARVSRGELDPKTTLVFFDDHQHAPSRLPVLQKFGFRHAIFEDNYPNRTYALKAAFARSERDDDAEAKHAATPSLRRMLASYFEFPPMLYDAYPPRSLALQQSLPRVECMLHPEQAREARIGVTPPLLQPYQSAADAARLLQVLRTAVVPKRTQQQAQQRLGVPELRWEQMAELAFNDTQGIAFASGQLNMYCHIAYVEVKV